MTLPFLNAFSDSDWSSAICERKSTTSYLLRFGEAMVDSGKETIIAQCSNEAELVAASEAAGQITFARQIYITLTGDASPARLHIDIAGTVYIAKDIRQVGCRSKHIEIKHLFVGECVMNKRINTITITSRDNIADLLTTGLRTPDFIHHQVTMNVISVPI